MSRSPRAGGRGNFLFSRGHFRRRSPETAGRSGDIDVPAFRNGNLHETATKVVTVSAIL